MSRRLPPLLVTGTDTGVGKTLVSRAIVRALHRAGVKVVPLKLVETGCIECDGQLEPADGVALAHAAGGVFPLEVVAPERFALPAAPTVAARREGRTLTFEQLRVHVERAAALAPRTLIEGAGGLLVPLAEQGSFADFAANIGARVLVVARDTLGTLNHTLLTVEAARARKLAIAGVVLSATGPCATPLDHATELRALLRVPVFGPLRWLPGVDDDGAADALVSIGVRAEELWGDQR